MKNTSADKRESVAAPTRLRGTLLALLFPMFLLPPFPAQAQPATKRAVPAGTSIAGMPKRAGSAQPELGRESDFLLAPAAAAKECADWTAINVRRVNAYYGGSIELAPPDKSLSCTIRRVEAEPVDRKKRVTDVIALPVIPDRNAIVTNFLRRDEWSSSDLKDRVTQLTDGKSSFRGRLAGLEQQVTELKGIESTHTRLHAQLVSLQAAMRSAEPWPKLAEVASALWPHYACLVPYKGASGDVSAAKKAFFEQQGYFIATSPARKAFAFYGEYLQLVDGVMQYKSPHSSGRVMEHLPFLTSCEPGVAAVALPFYAERRPAPPTPGRRPLEAFRDVDELLQALGELGKWLEAESKSVGEAHRRAAKLLKTRAGELVNPVQDRLALSKVREQALADALQASLTLQQRLQQLAEEATSAQREHEFVDRHLTAALVDEQAMRTALAQTRLMSEKLEAEVSAAAAKRSAVALACQGASYNSCSNQVAKDEYDRSMYESSKTLTQALAARANADVKYQQQSTRLDALLDRILVLRDEARRLRVERDKAQLTLETESQLPPWDDAKHKAESASAAQETAAWAARLLVVEESLEFAKLVLARP